MGLAKVVAHYLDGTMYKGYTVDFHPERPDFHLQTGEGGPIRIHQLGLKAVFFVKTFEGDPARVDRTEFDGSERLNGRRLRVRFVDGETMPGATLSYHSSRPGFFLTPADPACNNERVYVLNSSARILAD